MSKTKREKNQLAIKAAIRLRTELSLVQSSLEFFRDANPRDRDILKRVVPGADAGRIAGLLTSLYDENELAAWLAFAEDKWVN